MRNENEEKIALHDSEKEHLKHKTFPNLALMKISAYHKSKGDTVEWFSPLESYDKVYSSKIFTFTPENPYLPKDTIKGGTGYDIKSKLPPEIDDMYPDYSIYPECDYAIDFLTRGCVRNCPWCVVPTKEGKIKAYRNFEEVARPDSKKIILLDNNILASKHGISELEKISKTSYKIDCNQGLDCRLVTPEIADVLAKIKWIKFIRFSCDTVSQIEYASKAVNLLHQRKVVMSKFFFYVLVKENIEEAIKIVDSVRCITKAKATIYAQPERDFKNEKPVTKKQKEFSGRYVYKGIWRKTSWETYLKERQQIKF